MQISVFKIEVSLILKEMSVFWLRDISISILFFPLHFVAPAPGLYTCIKSWIKLYKIRLRRHFFETCNKWMKWQDISVDIKTLSFGGCLAPAPGLYTCIKSWKKLYKIRLERDFFETCNKWLKWQDVPVDIKISSPRCCQLLPQGYIHV